MIDEKEAQTNSPQLYSSLATPPLSSVHLRLLPHSTLLSFLSSILLLPSELGFFVGFSQAQSPSICPPFFSFHYPSGEYHRFSFVLLPFCSLWQGPDIIPAETPKHHFSTLSYPLSFPIRVIQPTNPTSAWPKLTPPFFLVDASF